ncbi:NHLP bacteriocin system secretion protein [Aquabacter sp. CN5-332]|uniref:NHLP bacteriocin system secretion protein n=1 Tax=Aquabacter sp. CN5-332 TaxID=3156608 RepID=UPI0032B31A69
MSGSDPLFRPQAVASLAVGDDHHDALRVMRPRLWGAGLALVALVVGAVAWSAVFTVPISVDGEGIVLSPGRIIDVVADATGQIRELTVGPGDIVELGMVVARVEQPDLRLKLGVARGELDDALRFRDALVRFQEREAAEEKAVRTARLASLGDRVAALQHQGGTLREQQAGLEQLLERKMVTRERLIEVSAEVLEVGSQIADARDEISKIESLAVIKAAENTRTLLEADRKVTEARRSVTTMEEQLERLGSVRSPFRGHVVEVKANIGQMVQPGTPILAVERVPRPAPNGRSRDGVPAPLVVAYVKAADGKKIAAGMVAEISPLTAPREEYGFIRGHVVHVAEAPASTAGMIRTLQNDRLVGSFVDRLGVPLEITIEPEMDPGDPAEPLWSSGRGAAAPPVASGTLADVRVTVRSTSLLSLILPILNRLRDRG